MEQKMLIIRVESIYQDTGELIDFFQTTIGPFPNEGIAHDYYSSHEQEIIDLIESPGGVADKLRSIPPKGIENDQEFFDIFIDTHIYLVSHSYPSNLKFEWSD